MLEQIKRLNEIIAGNKLDLANHNIDKTIPLATRWEMFVTAPACLKESKGWIEQFEFEKEIENFSWSDVFFVERYRTVECVELVDMLWERESPDKFINKVKEEILNKNLHSFTFDW